MLKQWSGSIVQLESAVDCKDNGLVSIVNELQVDLFFFCVNERVAAILESVKQYRVSANEDPTRKRARRFYSTTKRQELFI